jgi:hypothetical protein
LENDAWGAPRTRANVVPGEGGRLGTLSRPAVGCLLVDKANTDDVEAAEDNSQAFVGSRPIPNYRGQA